MATPSVQKKGLKPTAAALREDLDKITEAQVIEKDLLLEELADVKKKLSDQSSENAETIFKLRGQLDESAKVSAEKDIAISALHATIFELRGELDYIKKDVSAPQVDVAAITIDVAAITIDVAAVTFSAE